MAVFFGFDLSSYMTGTAVGRDWRPAYDTEIIATVRQFVKKEIFPMHRPSNVATATRKKSSIGCVIGFWVSGRRLQGYRHHRVHPGGGAFELAVRAAQHRHRYLTMVNVGRAPPRLPNGMHGVATDTRGISD